MANKESGAGMGAYHCAECETSFIIISRRPHAAAVLHCPSIDPETDHICETTLQPLGTEKVILTAVFAGRLAKVYLKEVDPQTKYKHVPDLA